MTIDAGLIEDIVQQVLRQLGPAAPAAPQASPVATAVAAPAAVSEIVLAETIITQELLEQRLGASRKIRIGAKAIVTPSARDVIRHRGIEIVRESAPKAAATVARWQVLVSRSTPAVTASLDGLRAAGVATDHQLVGATPEAAALAISAISRGEKRGVVLLSAEPELVACLANRSDKVRAAALTDAARLAELHKSFQPNVLAIDPTGRSQFELRQLLKQIVSL